MGENIEDERKGEDQDAAVIKVLWTHSTRNSARELDQPRLEILRETEDLNIWGLQAQKKKRPKALIPYLLLSNPVKFYKSYAATPVKT